MGWKCFFGHSFKEIMRQAIKEYGEDRTIPISFTTHFLYECKKCGKRKTETLDGFWKEDDDDDGENPPFPPVLTPDDYYESITK